MAETDTAIELIDADIPRMRSTTFIPALVGVTWQIPVREFWAVGSPPGGGKTDLLCTVAALQRPIKGTQRIFGQDIREMSEHDLVAARQKVAMVFDSGRLFPHLTIAENLSLPLAYHGHVPKKEIADKVEAVLNATGLAEVRDRRPNQMTRNLHQRAGLARALVLNPEVLLVDNPLRGTDPRQSRWWLEFLCRLNQGHELFGGRGITIVIAADDLRAWSDFASQFAVIVGQRLRVVGGRTELLEAKEADVRDLMTLAFDVG